MIKKFTNILVVVAMLMSFLGQAWANATMSCEMSANSHQSPMMMNHTGMNHASMIDHSSMNHESMSHEGMNHANMAVSTSSPENCCGVECACPVNACTSLMFLHADNTIPEIIDHNLIILSHVSVQPHSIYSSLFRPPIFA